MQRKILLSLILLLACVATGGLFASRYVTHTTAELRDLIELHQIENLRRSLVINVQSVQSDLYTLHTPLAYLPPEVRRPEECNWLESGRNFALAEESGTAYRWQESWLGGS